MAGTSYHNYASPFIRYNTEDVISDITENEGILQNFKISKGRSGEFVLDKNGKRINLTGLIFGRHHELFNHASHLQVKQVGIGRVEIHYVAPQVPPAEAAALFDDRNVELDFTFVPGDEPVRTAAGKVRLLID